MLILRFFVSLLAFDSSAKALVAQEYVVDHERVHVADVDPVRLVSGRIDVVPLGAVRRDLVVPVLEARRVLDHLLDSDGAVTDTMLPAAS